MADEEDLVVTLGAEPEPEAGEKAAKPEPVPGPPPAAVAAQVAPQVGLQDLQQQIAAERRARAQTEETARRIAAERDQAIQYAQDAERRGGTNYEAYVDSQIQGMAGEMDTLAAHAEHAMNEGDFKTAAEINKRLGRLGGALAIAEREKLALQPQKQQQPQRQQPRQQAPQPQRQVPTDPVERAIANRTPATQAFLRKNPGLIRGDGTLKKIAIDAHDKALDAGHAVDTDGYFRYVEQVLGSNGDTNGAAAAPAPAEQRIPGYSAPVTRGPAPGGDSLAPGQFRLTPKMRRLAEEQGVTPRSGPPIREAAEAKDGSPLLRGKHGSYSITRPFAMNTRAQSSVATSGRYRTMVGSACGLGKLSSTPTTSMTSGACIARPMGLARRSRLRARPTSSGTTGKPTASRTIPSCEAITIRAGATCRTACFQTDLRLLAPRGRSSSTIWS